MSVRRRGSCRRFGIRGSLCSLFLTLLMSSVNSGGIVAQERWHYLFPDANRRPTYDSVHHLSAAQAIASGRGIRIGILDHGFGLDDHPDLYAGGVDLIGNGALSAYAEHGYWMALTVRETAPGAEIVALNTASRDQLEAAHAIVKAIDWAIDNDIQILTYSHQPFSKEARSLVDPAVERAARAGVLTVFIHYPSPFNIFPTGLWALEESDIGRADVNVLHYDYKLLITANYERALENGTPLRNVFLSVSSTAPVTAGIAALVLEVSPSLRPGQVKDLLVESSYSTTFDGTDVPRVLDALAAVSSARQRHR